MKIKLEREEPATALFFYIFSTQVTEKHAILICEKIPGWNFQKNFSLCNAEITSPIMKPLFITERRK